MLKKILFLCLLFSGIVLAQQYTNEKYEKYVGTKLGKYPLTVAGLKKAIASLDSGVVYIAYPGLWDTTGLGQIPNKISLHGYLFGSLTMSLSDSTHSTQKMVWYDTPGQGSYTVNTNGQYGYSPFVFVGRQQSHWGVLSTYNILDRYAYKNKQSGRNLAFDCFVDLDTSYNGTFRQLQSSQHLINMDADSSATGINYAMLTTSGFSINYKLPYQQYPWWFIQNVAANIDWRAGSDTVYVYGDNGIRLHAASHNLVETGVYFNSNIYNYYSDLPTTLSSRLLGVKNAYHFYGINNYPSWFGGTVNSGAGYNYSADTSSTDDYKIVLAGAHTLIAGLEVTFKALTANTDGATLQVNSLTAKAITKASSGAVNTALSTGDILAGQIVKCVYDGTQFQIISRLAQ